MDTIILNNNIEIPVIGYGTYLTSPRETEKLVSQALETGYRHIDTAQNYGNEHEVGLAVKNSGIDRDNIFITSKTQTTGFDSTYRGIFKSLDEFGLDYLDLMIIHWPNSDNIGTYRALEKAYNEGLVRAIGVSNFNASQLQNLIKSTEVVPVVDQIETHVLWQQQKMHEFLEKNNILHESWSPFGEGMGNILQNPLLKRIGAQYNKSAAQVILRYLIQNNIIVIPKSSNPDRMKENFEIFDFALDQDDLDQIRLMDEKKSYSGWPSSMREV